MIETSNQPVLGCNFSNIISYVSLGPKTFKCEMLILFPVNCQRIMTIYFP